MLTVLIIYTNGSTDLKDVLDLSDVCLGGVSELRVIRDERSKNATGRKVA